jgi:hypothetical protein
MSFVPLPLAKPWKEKDRQTRMGQTSDLSWGSVLSMRSSRALDGSTLRRLPVLWVSSHWMLISCCRLREWRQSTIDISTNSDGHAQYDDTPRIRRGTEGGVARCGFVIHSKMFMIPKSLVAYSDKDSKTLQKCIFI